MQIQSQYFSEVGNLNNGINAASLDAVIKSVEDINALVNAYYDQTKINRAEL